MFVMQIIEVDSKQDFLTIITMDIVKTIGSNGVH